VVIIIDVLSFTTCVDIAVARGAAVYPYKGNAAAQFAQAKNAVLASRDRAAEFSLAPTSLMKIKAGIRIVLPSPNGSALSTATGSVPTFAACLRNARSVAHAARQIGPRIAVIPAGERWWTDGGLRPALEDWLGAGAVISQLAGTKSYEAQAAEQIFSVHEPNLSTVLKQIASGIELIEQGFSQDVELAAQLNVSDTTPRLIDGA
jgi:2-phosphosulfolactate phosphatase